MITQQKQVIFWFVLLSILILGFGTTITAQNAASTFTTAEVVVNGVASADIEAKYHPQANESCVIETDDNVLAIAREEDNILIFSSSAACEGLVWISMEEVDNVVWDDADALEDLVTAVIPEREVPRPITTLGNYNRVCNNAETTGSFPQRPYHFFASSYASNFPDEVLATSEDEVNLILCIEQDSVTIQTCPYTGGYSIVRERRDVIVRFVNFQTGNIATQNRFNGTSPDICPSTFFFRSFTVTFSGDSPETSAWLPWAQQQVRSSGSAAATRTTVNADTMNARSEPSTSSEVVTVVQRGTPVNLIARNEAGDWVVALLPDMTQVWLFTNLLRLATDVASLPVADGAAADVPIQFSLDN